MSVQVRPPAKAVLYRVRLTDHDTEPPTARVMRVAATWRTMLRGKGINFSGPVLFHFCTLGEPEGRNGDEQQRIVQGAA